MTFEEFKSRPEFAKLKAVHRLAGISKKDLDIYISYVLKEKSNVKVEYINQLLENGEVSDIIEYNKIEMKIRYYDWGTALKHPEYFIFVTSMVNLFRDYKNTDLDLSNFNTSNVDNMFSMFAECTNLKNINLSGFDTSKVTSMSCMFTGCRSLIDLDLSSFNTSKTKTMTHMFSDCRSLINLNLSSFDTSNVYNMEDMFSGCSSLKYLDLSNFKTPRIKYTDDMFFECESLEYLDLSNFDTSNAGGIGEHMFFVCTKLKSVITKDKAIRKSLKRKLENI